VFGEELDFPTLDPEAVFLEVDACLVCFEHVQTEEKVDGASLFYVNALSTKVEVGAAYCIYSLTSMMVNEQGRWRSATFSWALWTRPRILAVPTPRAMPANLESSSLINLNERNASG
jgi:hypothetical protein